MRKFAAVLALAVAALPAAGCQPETACPAIAPAPVVALTVARDYAATVKTIRLRACQEGRCVESELELFPGSTTVDQGCEPGPGSDRACSATSSPDGTLTGMLMFDRLTESRIDATSSGIDVSGLPLPVRTVTFTPRVAYPYGQQCGRFISAGLILDAAGLRQAD
ncbi:hypothetical protein [Pseudarthrobacter sp. MM222]|uniref:hypothetical protein n=1 Tax=Pseudarthrobacter sp. MM222 TaxID=3018929 RepID=UPI002220A057|nr:hypothetical protein [Pseudarthrobacter sp. MM222]CAI3791062.1 hypothetical protein NKCBBBOE_00195 [Pseudarthrobacter sp. MM222]